MDLLCLGIIRLAGRPFRSVDHLKPCEALVSGIRRGNATGAAVPQGILTRAVI